MTHLHPFQNLVNKAAASGRLINDVINHGTPAMLVCSSCGCVREHRSKRMDGTCYTVCKVCHALTTTQER